MRHGPSLLFWGLLVLASLAGCAPFTSAPQEPVEEGAETGGEVRLGFPWLDKRMTVEVEGAFEGERFVARRVEIEEEDDELEVKSYLERVDLERDLLVVGGLEFALVPDSELLDLEGNPLERGALAESSGAWVKAEGVERDGVLALRRVRLRERGPDEAEEIQGRIESIEGRSRRLSIGGIPIKVQRSAQIVWDVEGQAPPPLVDRRLTDLGAAGLRRIRRLDDDDRRPDDQFTIGDFLTIGGELQWGLEWRKNHNLRDDRERDRLLHEASAKLELSFDISRHLFAFTQIEFDHGFVIFDDERDFDFSPRVGLNEGFVLVNDLPVDGVSFQLGRQDFDQGREWVMDENIDGARLWLNLDPVLVELSVSEKIFDEDLEEDGITNYIAGAYIEPWEDVELFVYGLHRSGGKLVDLDRWHFGASLEADFDPVTVWLDFGYVKGSEDDLDVEGLGIDVAAMYVFEDLDLEPSIYAGFAWGSGDDDLGDGKDSGFRQTGLQDNNDKFNGVTSFRYLGALVRPEVSNLMVFTLGTGLRLGKRTSLDFVYHHYRQVEAAPRLRDTRIRLDPNGLSKDVGNEWDLILGLEEWRPLEIEIVAGYFHPGAAFGPDADDAWFLTFEAEWNF